MEINIQVLVIALMGVLFFSTGILVLYWCVKSGQMSDFEAGARSIFTEEEPEGEQTDFFPSKKVKIKK